MTIIKKLNDHFSYALIFLLLGGNSLTATSGQLSLSCDVRGLQAQQQLLDKEVIADCRRATRRLLKRRLRIHVRELSSFLHLGEKRSLALMEQVPTVVAAFVKSLNDQSFRQEQAPESALSARSFRLTRPLAKLLASQVWQNIWTKKFSVAEQEKYSKLSLLRRQRIDAARQKLAILELEQRFYLTAEQSEMVKVFCQQLLLENEDIASIWQLVSLLKEKYPVELQQSLSQDQLKKLSFEGFKQNLSNRGVRPGHSSVNQQALMLELGLIVAYAGENFQLSIEQSQRLLAGFERSADHLVQGTLVRPRGLDMKSHLSRLRNNSPEMVILTDPFAVKLCVTVMGKDSTALFAAQLQDRKIAVVQARDALLRAQIEEHFSLIPGAGKVSKPMIELDRQLWWQHPKIQFLLDSRSFQPLLNYGFLVESSRRTSIQSQWNKDQKLEMKDLLENVPSWALLL